MTILPVASMMKGIDAVGNRDVPGKAKERWLASSARMTRPRLIALGRPALGTRGFLPSGFLASFGLAGSALGAFGLGAGSGAGSAVRGLGGSVGFFVVFFSQAGGGGGRRAGNNPRVDCPGRGRTWMGRRAPGGLLAGEGPERGRGRPAKPTRKRGRRGRSSAWGRWFIGGSFSGTGLGFPAAWWVRAA